ncbi:helix-turn-helix transcriptional regulator [Bacillus sp. FJAT-42315]|uniref:helix-turn-helix transcriptional regulator n=1 Tax=Bacillus sp. FJAT-42315 TaxID=2014077 RepID=UPI000C249CA9|nr:AraC family transcriptional regulator [Bacillus sp. FJAT-42315]
MNYQPVLQKTIDYIENHLHDTLTSEKVAAQAGFSPFHFHRIFQKETGMTATDYIRRRRLTNAALMLLYTDETIIQIAYHFHFNTQESFTRAFKKVYQLPPGQYRKIMSPIIHSNGGNQMDNQQNVKGWFLSGSHPHNYQMGRDQKVIHQGRYSGYLKSVTVQEEGEFATMMQQFKAEKFIGKRIKLSAFIKTEKVQPFCGMWMRVDNTAGDVLQFDNMYDRPIQNDTNWNLYSIVLDIPDNSSIISFGVLLSGTGHVWVDGVKFEEVDQSVPVTHIEISQEFLDEPINLSFEEDVLTGE